MLKKAIVTISENFLVTEQDYINGNIQSVFLFQCQILHPPLSLPLLENRKDIYMGIFKPHMGKMRKVQSHTDLLLFMSSWKVLLYSTFPLEGSKVTSFSRSMRQGIPNLVCSSIAVHHSDTVIRPVASQTHDYHLQSLTDSWNLCSVFTTRQVN